MKINPGFEAGETQKQPSSCVRFTHRDAAPSQWISRDPIAEEGGLNLYGYALNNPVSWTDPLGLEVPAPDSVDANPSAVVEIVNTEAATTGDTTASQYVSPKEWARDQAKKALDYFKNKAQNCEQGQHGDPYKKAGNYLRQKANEKGLLPEVKQALQKLGKQLIDYGKGVSHK